MSIIISSLTINNSGFGSESLLSRKTFKPLSNQKNIKFNISTNPFEKKDINSNKKKMIFKMVEKVMKNKTVKDQRLKKNKRFENHRKDIQLYNNYNKVNIRENIEIKNNINNNINIKDRYKDISSKNSNLSEINSKDKNIKNSKLYKNLAKDSLVYTNSNGTIKTLANPLMNEEDKKKLNDYIQAKFQYNSNNSNSKNNINIEDVKFDISNNNNYQNAKIEQKKKNEDYNNSMLKTKISIYDHDP